MGLFDDTFEPVNVAKGRSVLGEEEDLIGESVESLPPAQPTAAPPVEEPIEESVAEPTDSLANFVPVDEPTDSLANFEPVEVEEPIEVPTPHGPEDYPSYYEGYSKLGEEMGAEAKEENEARVEYVNAMMGDIEPGSYTPDDFATDDELYNAILPYMRDRIGSVQIDKMDREEVVEKYLNNRRFVAMSGNLVSAATEYDYVNDIADDPEKLENAGRAYVIYENMAGITSDDYSWGELGASTWDVLRGVALDPVTYATFGLGKLAAGATTKSGVQALERSIMSSVQSQLARGVAPAAVEKGAQALVKEAVQTTATQQAADLAAFATRNSQTIAQRFQTKAAWAEIGATVAADAVVGSGVEFLYQDQLTKTGAQAEINRNSIALAALASFGMGLASGVFVATRGFSGTALPSQTVKGGSGKEAADSLRESLSSYFDDLKKDVDVGTSWASKVNSGADLDVNDTDFFIDILLGVSTKNDVGEETVHLKGLAQVMQEEGFYFTRRTEDDKISNFIADFITEELDPEDVSDLVKAFETNAGIKLTGFVDEAGEAITGTPTPEQFANAFAKKINSQARGLNSVRQASDRLGIDLEDMDVEKYLEAALGQRLVGSTKLDTLTKKVSNTVTRTIAGNQNRYIRALVTHLGTSKLNVLGWGVSSGVGSASDLLRATAGLGLGQLQETVGMTARGATNKQVSLAIMKANANRINLLLDPDMTAAAFNSALSRNSGALERMGRTQAGGVDESLRTVADIVNSTLVGRGADKYIDVSQTAMMVRAQDTFTKSQEYVFQMDKGLRILTGKSWNEFYTSPDANRIMATKQYRELEESVVGKVMQHTFSESFKGPGVLGEIAGVIEDARNMPGVGMLVPFGRFFNNTVAFSVRHTPGLNNVVKASGKFENLTHGELVANGLVAGGLATSYVAIAQDQRKQGLGMYEVIDEDTGEVRSREYDYPLSLFMGVGHALSYKLDGQEIPSEVVDRLIVDFGISGLTRGLTTTSDNLSEAFKYLVAGELERASVRFSEAGGSVLSQYTAGMTRPLQGYDTIVGIGAGIDMRPQNVKDGNLFVGRALSYVDNTVQLFTGKPFNDVRVGAVTGEADVDTGAQVGTRTVRLTYALRLMNMMDYEAWDENAPARAMQMAAEAGNEYNRMFFELIEEVAKQAMTDEAFVQMPVSDQRAIWEQTVTKIRDEARVRLSYEYQGEQSTFSEQLDLTDRYTRTVLEDGMDSLGMERDLGALDDFEIRKLGEYLDSKKLIETYERGGVRGWSK